MLLTRGIWQVCMLCGTPDLGSIPILYFGTLLRCKAWLCRALLKERVKARLLGCLCCHRIFCKGSCGRALGGRPSESRPFGSFALRSFVLVYGRLLTYPGSEIDLSLSVQSTFPD